MKLAISGNARTQNIVYSRHSPSGTYFVPPVVMDMTAQYGRSFCSLTQLLCRENVYSVKIANGSTIAIKFKQFFLSHKQTGTKIFICFHLHFIGIEEIILFPLDRHSSFLFSFNLFIIRENWAAR